MTGRGRSAAEAGRGAERLWAGHAALGRARCFPARRPATLSPRRTGIARRLSCAGSCRL